MKSIVSLFFAISLASVAIGQIASGGQFTLTQSVIAGGGNSMQSGQFKVDATTGQSVAGQKASNQPFGVHAGFWTPEDLLPTAEHVSLAGRITTADGRGIQNVRVTMTGPDGLSRYALSGPFGYFRFDDVEVGMTYVFSVTAKRYQFQQSVIARNVLDSVDDLNFVALEN
jgi:hypothetical protein